MRTCSRCGETKPLDAFYKGQRKTSKNPLGLTSACKVCLAVTQRKHYYENQEVFLANSRKWYYEKGGAKVMRLSDLRRKYGLTESDFDQLFANQHGWCAICHMDLVKPYIDHDHITGQIRGLLCGPCNMALGGFGDATNRLINAVNYMQNPPARNLNLSTN